MRRLAPWLLALVAVAAFWQASVRNTPLRDMRRDLGISQADPLDNAPPLVAFTTVAFGGFRGVIADMLWLRATRLQEQGQYFELVQLADWITKLEPRFTQIWAYHAWNLAYNISVLFDDPADRWRWVRHGITLLRDDGLRYNPGDARLLSELGWLFQHKIGASLDNAHRYYKEAWASEMTALFDGPRPDYGAFEMTATTRDELLARRGMPEFLAELRAAGIDPFAPDLVAQAAAKGIALETPLARELVDFVRFSRMREEYRLDPAILREVDASYGPLDWRLPQAHAIYWAWQARLAARVEFDRLAADRMIFQSLSDAFRQGALFTGARGDLFVPSPNPDLIPRVQAAYERAIEDNPGNESVAMAYRNFLNEALVTLVAFNRVDDARRVFDEIAKRHPEQAAGKDFTAYAATAFVEGLRDLNEREAQSIVEGALTQAFTWQAVGDPARAAGYDRLARLAWDGYMADRADSEEFRERTGLPPLNALRAQARDRVLAERGMR